MAGAVADSTQDWLLPEQSRPPTIRELELRIEEALATARASEAAVMTVGAAAIDAAEQAKRAADLAERASAAMHGAALRPEPVSADAAEEGLRDFRARADYVTSRLRKLQRMPLPGDGRADEARCDPVTG